MSVRNSTQGICFADRRRGALLGLAVGDALGAAVEFLPRDVVLRAPVTGYRRGGHPIPPGGGWTDDTSMALALADSIARAGWDLNDQMRRYLAWRDEGAYSVIDRCFDIGVTTNYALQRFKSTGDARTAGDPDEYASGNGSIMRLAPVVIHFADLFPDAIAALAERAAESSLTTHPSQQCLSACAYLALVLAALLHGVLREEVLAPDWPLLAELHTAAPLHGNVLAVARGSFREKSPPEIQGSGYVVRSLEAALWAFHDAADFREAVLRAVNLGDDADTTGAVCGQLAGAYWGESGIPPEWLEELVRREMIERAMEGLGCGKGRGDERG